MKVKGQFEWTDYLKAQLLHTQPNGFIRVINYALLGLLGCGLIGLLIFSVTNKFSLELILPVLLLVAFIALYRYVFLPYRVKKVFFQQKELSAPFEFEITETSLNSSNEFGNSTRPWENFTKWKENKDLLLLYLSDVMFSMLPKRIFSDPQQIETIKAYLEKNKVHVAKNRFPVGCVIYIILLIIIGGMLYISFRSAASQ